MPGHTSYTHLQLVHALLAYMLLTACVVLLFLGVEQCTQLQQLSAAVSSSVCSSVLCFGGRWLLQWGNNVGARRRRALTSNVDDRSNAFITQLSPLMQLTATSARARGTNESSARRTSQMTSWFAPARTLRSSGHGGAAQLSASTPRAAFGHERGGSAWELSEKGSGRTTQQLGSPTSALEKAHDDARGAQLEWLRKQQAASNVPAANQAAAAEESSGRRGRNPYSPSFRRSVAAESKASDDKVKDQSPAGERVSAVAQGTWLLLFPSQLAEEEEGTSCGFYYPRPEQAGGIARSAKERLAFVPLTDIRSADDALCGGGAERRVLCAGSS